MLININLNFSLNIDNCNFSSITTVIKNILSKLISDIFYQIILIFVEKEMKKTKKSFCCDCGNSKNFIYKTKGSIARVTKIKSIFGTLEIPQIQLKCKCCGKKIYITRTILEIEKYKRYPNIIKRLLAFLGAVTTYRVGEKIVDSFNMLNTNKSAIIRSVKEVSKTINFSIDKNEIETGQVDGTGIPIRGGNKRGLELKVLMQNMSNGKMRIAGLDLSEYKNWEKMAKQINDDNLLICCDGDKELINKLESQFNICLWHLPHLTKYYLWESEVKRDSYLYKNVMSKIYDICEIDSLETDYNRLYSKKVELISDFINQFRGIKEIEKIGNYLNKYKYNLFHFLKYSNLDKTTSKVERSMRTINNRIDIGGSWSRDGALSLLKIRLAHYYNNWVP